MLGGGGLKKKKKTVSFKIMIYNLMLIYQTN